MAEDVMFQEAVEAVRQGQRTRARDLLTRLLRADQNNPEYWLWMSAVVETSREQIFCLNNVLRLDPKNAAARQGLTLMGALPGETKVTPAPIQRRRWEAPQQEVPELTGLRAVWANPAARIVILSIVVLALFGLLWLGVATGIGRQRVARVFPTSTAGPSPTFTSTPTALNQTPATASPMATAAGPVPLWARLAATYTPTPNYALTPHPANESYQIAMRALQRGELQTALEHFEQAQRSDLNSADILYAMGQVYAGMEKYEDALRQYELAIEANPNFAPAYAGRARALAALQPRADVSADLQTAIEKDPNYIEARLAYIDLLLKAGELDGAQQQLEQVENRAPDTALTALYQARLRLAQGDIPAALEAARKANELDRTLLEGYLLRGQAAAASGELREAGQAIRVYLEFEDQTAAAWTVQGQTLYASGQYSQTVTALTRALNLDRGQTLALRYRGLALIELGQGQKAVNDLGIVLQGNSSAFQPNVEFSRALLTANRLDDALGQINHAEDLAESDADLAQLFYYRAQIYEGLGNLPRASDDWKALRALPEEAVPARWRALAEARLKATATLPPPTATVTRTATRTPLPSATPTQTRTPRPSATPTATRTPRPSQTPTPTATRTPRPSQTPTLPASNASSTPSQTP